MASLKETLRVTKNKENSGLIEISYSHRDSQLAADLVNTLMEQFQNYLAMQGKNRIEKQLLYLKQRQKEALTQLEEVLENQKAILEEDLHAGNILTLEKELGFVAQQQGKKRQEMIEVCREMQGLARLLVAESLTFDQLIERLKTHREKSSSQVLSIESARQLIMQHQKQLEEMRLDHEKYEFCLSKLSDPEFDSSSLSKTLREDFLHARFDKMHTLHHRLVDAKNWSDKERELLKEELEMEKRFLIHHIHHLQEGAALQENILKERLLALQHDLLDLLFQHYEHLTLALNNLNAQVSHFPQKWLNDKKIKIHAELGSEMMRTLTQLVETKNIGYHIDYLMPAPLQPASAPVIPANPHLLLGFMIGGVGAFFMSLVALFLYQGWRGPTASVENLAARGKELLPQKEFLPRLGREIAKQGKIISFGSKGQIGFIKPLISWLEKSGKKITLLDLAKEGVFKGESDREAYLASQRFQDLLSQLSLNYDHILIVSVAAAQSFEVETLSGYSDRLLYGVSDEMLEELEILPEATLFFIQEKRIKKGSKADLVRLLEALMKRVKGFSFSSLKRVWEHFPLRKI